jgi:hypothetical protein
MKPRVTQVHHVLYGRPEEELKMPIGKGEHRIMSLLQRYCRKRMTEEFALCLAQFVLDAYMRGKITRRER